MRTSIALIAAATSVFVFTQAADAQCGCEQTVSYYAPVWTTAYYAPTTAYYPTSTYNAQPTAYYGGSGYYGGSYGGGGYGGGLFGTGVGGWAGVRGINRRWDRRGW